MSPTSKESHALEPSGEFADQWLIRTSDNQIYGPYNRQQLCQLIDQAKLQLNDEICHANTYWIYLREHQEVKSQLGIEIPKSMYAGIQEATLTETETEMDEDVGERTDPELLRPTGQEGQLRVAHGPIGGASVGGSVVRPSSEPNQVSSSNELDSIPELADLVDDLGENTAVMSNRAFRDFRHGKTRTSGTSNMTVNAQINTSSQPSASPLRRAPQVEKSKLLHYLAFLLMMGAVVLLVVVLKLLRQ